MKQIRKIVIILLILSLLCVFAVTATANSPAPAPWFIFSFSNLPEGTVYVDLLIHLPETDPKYTDLVESNLPDGFLENAQIITYCEDNYRSYTFHYRDALSAIKLDAYSKTYFFTTGSLTLSDDTVRYNHEAEIRARGKIRIAMLDESGNILKVSSSLSLRPPSLFASVGNSYYYDAQEDLLTMDYHISAVVIFLFIIISIFGIFLNCVIEGITAWPFGLDREYRELIRRTNIVSQLLMRVLHVLLYSIVPMGYVLTVLVLEVPVFVGEFLFYRKRMWDVSQKKCLLYTITANTLSLILGLLTNTLLIIH